LEDLSSTTLGRIAVQIKIAIKEYTLILTIAIFVLTGRFEIIRYSWLSSVSSRYWLKWAITAVSCTFFVDPYCEYSAFNTFIKYVDVTCIQTKKFNQTINFGNPFGKSIKLFSYIVKTLIQKLYAKGWRWTTITRQGIHDWLCGTQLSRYINKLKCSSLWMAKSSKLSEGHKQHKWLKGRKENFTKITKNKAGVIQETLTL